MKQVVPTYKEPEEVNKKKERKYKCSCITYIVIINYKRGDDDQYE